MIALSSSPQSAPLGVGLIFPDASWADVKKRSTLLSPEIVCTPNRAGTSGAVVFA